MTDELKYTNWYEDLPDKGTRGKYGTKSTHEKRMGCFCIYHDPNNNSVTQSEIAEVLGMHPAVVSMMLKLSNTTKYARMKQEYAQLGHTKAYYKYVTDELINKFRALKRGTDSTPLRPGSILLGGRDFIVAQIDNGKWVGTDIETNSTTDWHDTRTGAVDESIILAKLLTQGESSK